LLPRDSNITTMYMLLHTGNVHVYMCSSNQYTYTYHYVQA